MYGICFELLFNTLNLVFIVNNYGISFRDRKINSKETIVRTIAAGCTSAPVVLVHNVISPNIF